MSKNTPHPLEGAGCRPDRQAINLHQVYSPTRVLQVFFGKIETCFKARLHPPLTCSRPARQPSGRSPSEFKPGPKGCPLPEPAVALPTAEALAKTAGDKRESVFICVSSMAKNAPPAYTAAARHRIENAPDCWSTTAACRWSIQRNRSAPPVAPAPFVRCKHRARHPRAGRRG